MLNSAEYEIFSANKYENAKLLLAFTHLLAEKIPCSARFSRKEFAIVSNMRIISMKTSCLAELSMKKVI